MENDTAGTYSPIAENVTVKEYISKRYILALCILAIISISAFGVLSYFLSHQKNSYETINVSGKQRTLSQQISLYTVHLAHAETREEKAKYKQKLFLTLKEMQKAHKILTGGLSIDDEQIYMPSALYALYYDVPHHLNDKLENYFTTITDILRLSAPFLTPQNNDIQSIILQKTPQILPLLEEAVLLYQNDAQNHLKRTRHAVLAITALFLIALLLQGILLFRPMAKRVGKNQAYLFNVQDNQDEPAPSTTINDHNDFIINISHELTTPLNSILGMSELLLSDQMDETKQQITAAIQSSAILLNSKVQDIVEIVKLQQGTLTQDIAPFDITDCIQKVLDIMTPLTSQKDITLTSNFKQIDFPYVLGDGAKFISILTKLVSNAVSYTKAGSVNISISFIHMSKNHIILTCRIIDTGIGIDAERIKSLWGEQTGRLNRSQAKIDPRSMGLSVAKQLVHALDGDIGVDSAVGEGSTFWFKLPLETTTIMPDHNALQQSLDLQALGQPGAKKPAGQARILIAEDHDLNMFLMQKIIQRFGVETIDCTSDGEDTLKNAMQHGYDLIFLDCHMPKLSGQEVVHNIRHSDGPNKATPIIAMTANALRDNREQCLQAGMTEYLSKPFGIRIIRQLMAHWFELEAPEEANANASSSVPAPHQNQNDESPAAIDMSVLDGFTGGDTEILAQFWRIYTTETNKNIRTLSEHCSDGENKTWVETAHLLKGGSGSIGAIKMQKLSAQAQDMNAATAQARKAILAEIEAEYAKVIRYFTDLLG